MTWRDWAAVAIGWAFGSLWVLLMAGSPGKWLAGPVGFAATLIVIWGRR